MPVDLFHDFFAYTVLLEGFSLFYTTKELISFATGMDTLHPVITFLIVSYI
nr:MAG TPA: hypothetical protein [Caudoviricetes sp.]